ncbi:ABC transporter ATP-binding protein [Saccharopolyspora spinosa]|uniref:Fatty acid ABC transporter ATP-binding/permease protein n=1 Tax=Saccharopolyspora spinosa TaxID=60894 RepID=A0A2N3Y0Y5_SACSN|nr:ABC transporter ATP-binding protein [Saccharopolyspora spinosa]PKW16560.1 ATP-binding cassette subfamily B protein [Saccharopolyspora spinosa]
MSERRTAVRLALRYYWREFFSRKWMSIPGVLGPAMSNIGIRYVAPLVVAGLAGRISGGMDVTFGSVAPWILGFAAVLLAGEVFWRIGQHCLNRTEGYGVEHLYVLGMNELLAKDAAFFHDNFAGALTKRAVSFASRFEEFVDMMAFSVLANLVPLLFASAVLWQYDPILVFVLVGLIALTGFVIAPLVRRRQKLVEAREAQYAQVSGCVADTIGNMSTVRAFAAEAREASEHRDRVAHLRRLAIRSWDYTNLRIDVVIAPLSVLTNALGLLTVVSLSGGRLGVEGIIVAFTYFSNATRIMFEFNRIYRRLESSLTEAAQFTELLLTPPTVLEPPAPEPLRPAAADIRFERVRFAHPGAPTLFDGLDLAVPSGTTVGLVGRSGGGKTTLTQLLLRLTDVESGTIRVCGHDIARLRQADLRSLIAYVPQEPAMFHRSLRENIVFARPDATEAEIQKAAQAAHVTEFAESLPDGFDTLVGERGIKLSGGQRQRVALARAILRDAPILLLDEATSALDSQSEILIQEALWQIMAGRTALVVAHRLSTVARMDQLVVLDHGEIIEQGTHNELLARRGTYARLWQHQSGGFLIEDKDDAGTPAHTRGGR